MKKLSKRDNMEKNTLEAYALGCGCTCVCYCLKIGKIDLYGSSYGDTFAQIAMIPKIG